MPDKLVKSVSVRITVDGADDALLKMGKVRAAAEKLKAESPIDIRETVDRQRALMEARLTRMGIQAEFAKAINQKIEVQQSFVSRLGGLLGKGLTGGGGWGSGGLSGVLTGGSGIVGSIGSSAGGLGWVAIAAGAAALSTEIAALGTGLAAATAGVGAFGALAYPTVKNVTTAYTSLNAAQQKYNAAVALQKEDPTKQHAKDVANALTALHVVEEGLTPSTRHVIDGIHQLGSAFDSMAKSFQPQVLKVFNDALKTANILLPALKPMAQAAFGAIDPLLNKLAKTLSSPQFQAWLGHFDKLIGPAISAIGTGIGHVANAIGTLFTRFSGRDVQHGITVFFDTLTTGIRWTVNAIGWLMTAWDQVSNKVSHAWRNMEIWTLQGAVVVTDAFRRVAAFLLNVFDAPIHAVRKIADAVGIHTFDGLDNALQGFHRNMDKTMNDAMAKLQSLADGVRKREIVATIKGNITDLQAKLRTAQAELHKTTSPAYAAHLRGEISDLLHKVAQAKAALAGVQGKTVYINVKTIYSAARGYGQTGPGGHAAGGPSSGLTWVGESGPELVYTPPGSYVYNNAQSRQMASSGGNHYTIIQNIPAAVNKADVGRSVVEAIREFEQRSGHSWRK